MTTQSPSLPSHPTSTLAPVSEEGQITRKWIIYGAIAGILAVFAYVSAIAPLPFPEMVKIYLGMAFGPLISLAFVGLYHFFKLHRKTVALQAATIFGIIAGTLVNLMIVVQSAIHLTIPADARESLGLAYAGLNMVQLGMDVSWDIYLSSRRFYWVGHVQSSPVWQNLGGNYAPHWRRLACSEPGGIPNPACGCQFIRSRPGIWAAVFVCGLPSADVA
jgi:hypothetical protein